MLEDQIYALQDLLDRTQDRLEACQREKGPTQSKSAADRPASAQPDRPSLSTPRGLKVDVPADPLPSGQIPETLLRGGPPRTSGVRPSAPTHDTSGNPVRRQRPSEPKEFIAAGPVRRIPPLAAGGGARDRYVTPTAAIALARGDNRNVRAIALHRELTAGWNRDNLPGDDGIRVAIEPADAQGKRVAAAGRVAVVVIDAALPGAAARFARWDLSAEEVAATYRKTPAFEGFCLDLVWPASSPAHRQLQVFVRYVTDEGRKLETHLPLQIALPGEPSQRWSAVSLRSSSPNEGTGEELSAEEQVSATQAAPAEKPDAPMPPPSPASLPRPSWSPQRG